MTDVRCDVANRAISSVVSWSVCMYISENIRLLHPGHNQGNPEVHTVSLLTFTSTISGLVGISIHAHRDTHKKQKTHNSPTQAPAWLSAQHKTSLTHRLVFTLSLFWRNPISVFLKWSKWLWCHIFNCNFPFHYIPELHNKSYI